MTEPESFVAEALALAERDLPIAERRMWAAVRSLTRRRARVRQLRALIYALRSQSGSQTVDSKPDIQTQDFYKLDRLLKSLEATHT